MGNFKMKTFDLVFGPHSAWNLKYLFVSCINFEFYFKQ